MLIETWRERAGGDRGNQTWDAVADDLDSAHVEAVEREWPLEALRELAVQMTNRWRQLCDAEIGPGHAPARAALLDAYAELRLALS